MQDLQQLARDQFDLLLSSGFFKSTTTISLDNQAVMVKALSLHHTLLVCKAEHMEGLKSLGVLSYIKQSKMLLEQFFCIKPKLILLTAGILL